MIVQHVNDYIIENKSSWGSVCFDKVNTLIVFTEKVNNEGLGFSSDFIDKFAEIGVGVYGKDGTKNLFLHDGAIHAWFLNDGWWEMKFVRNNLASI